MRGSLLRVQPVRHIVDQVDVVFDDERVVVVAGLLLQATLAERLGIEKLPGQLMELESVRGGASPDASCSAWSPRSSRATGRR
jgi:hypothetical protein